MATIALFQATAYAAICVVGFVGRPASAGVFEDYVTAWNSHDLNKTADFFTEDSAREVITMRVTRHGREEIRKSFESLFKNIPDAKVEIKSSFVADGQGCMEWRLTGTEEKTQKHIDFRGVDVVQLSGNKIAGGRVYFLDYTETAK